MSSAVTPQPLHLPFFLPSEWYPRENFAWPNSQQPVCLTVEVDGVRNLQKFAAIASRNKVRGQIETSLAWQFHYLHTRVHAVEQQCDRFCPRPWSTFFQL